MSLLAERYQVKTKVRIDRNRNKKTPRTLLAHLEEIDGVWKVLDLTNSRHDFPRVIISLKRYDEIAVIESVSRYMNKNRYTNFTVSFFSKTGMQLIH